MINIKTESVQFDSSYSSIPQKETNLEQESQIDNVLGQVWVSEYHQAICIPANSAKLLTGKTNKIQKKYSCSIEPRDSNNLPLGVVVSGTIITPKKSKQVLIILINTNSYNIWIRQPLLAANVVEAEHCPWDHTTNMTSDGEEIKILCHQIPTAEVQEEIQQQDENLKDQTQTQSQESESKTYKEKPKFGPPPDFDSSPYNFKEEFSRLLFPVNMGDVEMSFKQQKWFLNLVYDYQTVFSLHNEDLDLCDLLKHTILTTTDKTIYLPHQTIPVQLQTEV